MNVKEKVILIVCMCLMVVAGAFIADRIISKNYFKVIEYKDLIKKIENKEDVIILISQTTCGHCASYKPKLEEAANKHKIDIYYIDVDLLNDEERTELKSYINFDGTPATVFLRKGEESSAATRINGDASREKIEKKLKSNGFID